MCSQKRNFKKPRLKTFFAILYSNRFLQKVLRELGLFRPAENLSTLFLFNAIQFDSDISTQDLHLLNDIKKMKRVQTPFSPTYTSHPIFTKINGLKYITTMNTDELSSKAKGQTGPQSDLYFILTACTHQCLFPLRL